MSLTIRDAVQEDNRKIRPLQEQIAALHYQGRPDLFKTEARYYSDDDFEAKLNDPNQFIYIAEADQSHVVGYVFGMIIHCRNHSTYQDFDFFYIDDICVDERQRQQGIGKMLFETCCEQAKKYHCHHIDLGVYEFNSDAIAFYESCGMKTKSRKMERIL